MPNLEVTMNIASIVPAILSALDPCAKEKKTRSTDKIVLNQKGIRKGLEAIADVILKLNQHHPDERFSPMDKGKIKKYIPGSVHAIIEGDACAMLTLCKDGTTDDVSLIMSNVDDEKVIQMARKYCKAKVLSNYRSEWIRTSSIHDFDTASNHLEPSNKTFVSLMPDSRSLEVFRSKNNMLVLYAPGWHIELARTMYNAYKTKVKAHNLAFHGIIPADQQQKLPDSPDPEALNRLQARLDTKWDTHLKYAVAIVHHLAGKKVTLNKRNLQIPAPAMPQIRDEMVNLVNEVYSEMYASVGIFDETD